MFDGWFVLVTVIVGIVSGIVASKLLKINNGPIQWIIIGAVGTVFGYLFSWVFVQTGVAELALTILSTFLGSCSFILLSRLMKK
ncbi:MAG: hypothetical protein ACK5LZ_02435 [Anaerorhabdus sp.]